MYNFSSFPAFLFDSFSCLPSLVLFWPVFPPQFSVLLKKITTSFILLKILVLKSLPGCSILLISSEVNLPQFLLLLAAFLASVWDVHLQAHLEKVFSFSSVLTPPYPANLIPGVPVWVSCPIAIQGLSQTPSLSHVRFASGLACEASLGTEASYNGPQRAPGSN